VARDRRSAPPNEPTAELTDEELLARYVDGETDAFGEIVRRHRDRLWAVALRTLGDPEEAADAVQDALVSALRAARTFRGEAKVTTWLHRIVVNACLDRARRRQARPTVPLPTQEQAPIARDVLGESERATELAAALARLPVEQAAALVLVDALGYHVDEVAQILETPVGTVKSRCSRGRARLAVALGHLAPEGNRGASGDVTPSTGTTTHHSTGEEVDPR
jgi:RNA polymerase sigma-70 factor (ECF subfamily)